MDLGSLTRATQFVSAWCAYEGETGIADSIGFCLDLLHPTERLLARSVDLLLPSLSLLLLLLLQVGSRSRCQQIKDSNRMQPAPPYASVRGKKAGQGRAGQSRAGQGRAGQDETVQGRTLRDRARQDRTRQGRTRQGRTGRDRAGQDEAGQDRARQCRTGQGRTRQGRAGQEICEGNGLEQRGRAHCRWFLLTGTVSCASAAGTTGGLLAAVVRLSGSHREHATHSHGEGEVRWGGWLVGDVCVGVWGGGGGEGKDSKPLA